MTTLPQDGDLGTYGERKPRIARKSMKVGEQDVGLEGSALAAALDTAARASTSEVAAGDEPASETAGPAEEPDAPAPAEGDAAPSEPAPPEAASEAPAVGAVEEQPQPEAAPVTPATEPGSTAETVTIPRAEYDELKRGGLMQADYTRKTQALADLRKESDKAQAEARAERDQYLSLIKQVEDLLSSAAKEPDWAALRHTLTPEQYADARDQYARVQSDRESAANERERVEKRKMADTREQYQKTVDAEKERLFTVMPDLRDQKVLTPWLRRMHATAKALGFSDEEFSGIADHRLFLVLNQAAKGAPVAATPPKTTKPTVARPRSVGAGAAPVTRTPQNVRDKAMDELKGKKSVKAAGDYFATLDI